MTTVLYDALRSLAQESRKLAELLVTFFSCNKTWEINTAKPYNTESKLDQGPVFIIQLKTVVDFDFLTFWTFLINTEPEQ